MMSGGTFPQRFTKIDNLTRPDHYYLTEGDACYFIGEYTAYQGFSYSTTNDLIQNFKKPMDRHGLAEWRHREQAIRQVAKAFRTALDPDALNRLTLVPIPPSKAKDDPLYNGRMTKMLMAIQPDPALDIRELIIQTESTESVHDLHQRPAPDEIANIYEIDEALTQPAPTSIAIVDDVLTTGAHFRAMHSVLSARFQGAHIVGLFIARRNPRTSELEDNNNGSVNKTL